MLNCPDSETNPGSGEVKPASRYETLRRDHKHWTLGVIYHCKDDPRIIVRNLAPFGWTWNFAHPRVFPAIAAAAAGFLGPAWLVYRLGVESRLTMALILLVSLGALVLVASRAARDPLS